MSSKVKLFEELTREVESCDSCDLCQRVKNRVMGEGTLDSPVVFVGEAPGRREDETGRPFVGSAGKMLDQTLAKAGLTRGDVFISNVVRCRPPGNRKPKGSEVEACSDHLERLLEIIEPRILAPMGNSAVEHIFERYRLGKAVIGEVHGKLVKTRTRWGELTIFPLYHPAAAIYNKKLIKEIEADMASLAGLLK